MEQERSGGFLPPEPPGPEPEFGGGPRTQPPPAAQPPAPAGQPPAGWQPPPGYGWQPASGGYAPAAREPDNGPAVAGFVLSLVAGGLLFFTAGLSSVISLGCAIAGMVYSRKGKRKVEARETTKNAGLAQAGFVISIVSLVLSALATAFWVLVLVLALVDDDFQRDVDQEFDDSQSISASLRTTGAAVRAAVHLLG